MTQQLDVFRHSAPALARAYREAADAAIRNPFESPESSRRRAEHYLAEAERIEREIRQ